MKLEYKEQYMEKEFNFQVLKKNLIDVTKEAQIKLGYTKTPIGFYYPLESINRLLDSDLDEESMSEVLQQFAIFVKNELGNISISRENKRFCIKIPEEGVEFVHEKVVDTGFLVAFIEKIGHCHLGIEDILQVFYQYSDCVICQQIKNEDFDYMICFEDGNPDDYRYCIKFEECGAIYHRFTPKDYEEMQKNYQ